MEIVICTFLLVLVPSLISASADRLVNVAGNLSVMVVDEDTILSIITDGDSKTCYNITSDKQLKIDLGETHYINKIVIEGDVNIQVQTNFNMTPLNDLSFNDCESDGKDHYHCLHTPHHARYVNLQSGDNGVLCEIQVLECKDGYFGHDCSKSCHCQSEEPCSKDTGVCSDRICLPGWEGENCQQACKEGTFGNNCGWTCRCKDTETCDVSNGTCPNGCLPRWYDTACQTAFPELSEKPMLHDHFPTQLLVTVPTLKTFYNSSTFALQYKTYVRTHVPESRSDDDQDWMLAGSLEHSKDMDKPLIIINDLYWNTLYDVKIVPVFKRRDPETRKFETGKHEPETTESSLTPTSSKINKNNKRKNNKTKSKESEVEKTKIPEDEQVDDSPNPDGNDGGDGTDAETGGSVQFSPGVNRNGVTQVDVPPSAEDAEKDGGNENTEDENEGESDNPNEEGDGDGEGEDDGGEGKDIEEDAEKDEIVGTSDALIFKTSCNKPESPNVTSVESWVDDKSDVIISVSWTPLSISQSNCDKISVYFVYYKKVGDSQWRQQAADANVTSKNLTGEDIESNSQYVLRVSSQNNMNLQSFSDTWRVKTLGKEGSNGAESFESDAMSSPGLVAVLIIILISLVITSIVLVIIMNRRRLKMMKGERSVPDSAILLKKSGYSVPMQNGSVVLEEDFEVSVLPWKNQGDQNKKSKVKAKPRVVRPAIKTDELEEYLKERSENNFEELRKEYKEIPEGNAEATTVAGLKMDNRLKNRFINIIPYDHSRVVLDLVDGDSTSDYINANYINGYNKNKFYIAAQGCNKWSVQDIWRMLWQENSLRIVVLTNLVEKGRPKCEQYWPDQLGEEKSYGDLGVTLTSVESSASHVVRSFSVRRCIETSYKNKTDNFGKSGGGSLKKSGSKKTSPDKTTQLRENNSDVDLKKAERESLLVKNGDIKENCLNDRTKRNGSIDGQHAANRTYENCKIRSTDAITSSGENIYANVEPLVSTRDSPEAWIEETREVKQFHFTSWPDHGVPYHTAPLIAFRNKVRKHDSTHPGPIIVHCSAGVGRSGTFIALDYLLEQAEAEKKVDLHGLTHNMRTDRCNMIQTVEQYIFVYEALIEAMKSRSSLISLSDFEARYKEIIAGPLGDSTKNGLALQFDLLMEAQSKMLASANCDARLPLNVCKNRNSSILPDDNHRPYLMTTVEGTNDYINAVFLDSYRRQNSIILTQMPLLNTVIDLWRMVRDHKCSAIIMINHFDTSDESAAQYWPEENEECECGPFLIETLSTDRMDSDIVTRQLQLNYFPDMPHKEKQSASTNSPPHDAPPSDDSQPTEGHEQPSEVHHVTHLQLINWSSHSNLPPSELPIIRLVEKIDEIQKKQPDQPIVIHCMDGASQSGLLVASVCIWERMKDELEVDVYETTKRLKSTRPHIINNLEQYSYLYKLVLLYLREFATYSNFN